LAKIHTIIKVQQFVNQKMTKLTPK